MTGTSQSRQYLLVVALAVYATISNLALAQGIAAANRDSNTADSAEEKGIWKAAVPLKPMHGEFENFDPLGVAAGARIKADCSLNWVSPDDGKLYCFSSGTSLVYFLDRPKANIERARVGWAKLSAQHITAK